MVEIYMEKWGEREKEEYLENGDIGSACLDERWILFEESG